MKRQQNRNIRILVIDDEENLRIILHRSLEVLGYMVESFPDGVKAMKRFNELAFDAVITDYLMPEMTGIEVARKVKSINPQIPVILVTGEKTLFENTSLKDSGVDFFMSKPYRIFDIVNTLKLAVHLHDGCD